MSGQLGDLVISLSADIARFSSDMGKSTQIAQKTAMDMTKAFEGVHGAITKIGTVMTGLAAGAGFAKMLNEAAAWNLEAAKMAKTLGTTSEQASVMAVALHGLGIGNDVAENAALKLSRALSKGTDTFDQYGIKVKDANGNLLPMPQIMANVNQALLATKTGTDRNIMALQLYGKSWGEMQAILKLTPAAMEEARETAERLHLVVGPEGIAQSLAYKKNMREVGLVVESLSVQMANELMPAAVSVGSALAGAGTAGASGFGKMIKEVIRDTQEASVYWAAFADKVAAWQQTGGLLYHTSGQMSDYKKRLEVIAKAETDQMAEIAKGYDQKPKGSKEPGGGRIAIPESDAAAKAADEYAKQIHSAHNAYLAYEKAYAEQSAAIVKNANALEEQLNAQSFEWGLTSLVGYLDKKHELNESSLQAEIDAKKTEWEKLKEAETKANAAYAKDKTGDTAKNANEAAAKATAARTVLLDAENKLALARKGNANEALSAGWQEMQQIGQLHIQVLELAGAYEEAAKQKQSMEQASPQYRQLTPEHQAARDAASAEAISQAGLKERLEKLRVEGMSAGLPNAFGFVDPAKQLENQYKAEREVINERLKFLEDSGNKETEEYRRTQAEKRNIDLKYKADKTRLDSESRDRTIEMAVGLGNQLANEMMRGNKAQFERGKALAMAMAAVDTGMAVSKALGAAAPPYNYIMAGLSLAAGIANEAKIASISYQARELGGPVRGGQTYLVGEKGPELFTAGASGQITSNANLQRLGGGTVNVTHVWQISTGVSETVRAEVAGLMPMITQQSIAATQQAIEDGAGMARSVGRR